MKRKKLGSIMTGEEFSKKIDKVGFYFVKHMLLRTVVPAKYIGCDGWLIVGLSQIAPHNVIEKVYTIPIKKPEHFK